MVVDPPGEALPIAFIAVAVDKPGNGDTGGCAHAAVEIPEIPYVVGGRCGVRGAVELVLVAEFIDRGGAVAGADVQPAEGRLQRLQQLLAEPLACFDRQFRIVRDIGYAVEVGDLGMQEVAKEEILGEPGAAHVFQRFHRSRLFHRFPPLISESIGGFAGGSHPISWNDRQSPHFGSHEARRRQGWHGHNFGPNRPKGVAHAFGKTGREEQYCGKPGRDRRTHAGARGRGDDVSGDGARYIRAREGRYRPGRALSDPRGGREQMRGDGPLRGCHVDGAGVCR
ncbi:conserved hypothetical protein [Ricinus communis]|uniref:Uncharacterized protein n=1 Tax=Ricinus communis TaxID=3988 RepID=B9TE81_RICCO|nr:conserved hypothetical protein [Ricinus communis]